jgi:hypothetical protein
MTPVERARHLASLFRTAQTVAIHPSSCPCGGGMFRPALTASGLELDLLDYLAPRYETNGPASLATLIQQRVDTQSTQRFESWLRNVAESDTEEKDILFDELEGLLTQMTEAANPGRFVCS